MSPLHFFFTHPFLFLAKLCNSFNWLSHNHRVGKTQEEGTSITKAAFRKVSVRSAKAVRFFRKVATPTFSRNVRETSYKMQKYS